MMTAIHMADYGLTGPFAALAGGTLSPERWSSFQKLHAENRCTEDNSPYMAEKRRKFKAIAKINRSSYRREEW